MTRNRLLTWTALLLAVFLAGLVPPTIRARGIGRELETMRGAHERCELRTLMGHVFLQTSMKNYGTALQYAGRFFDRARAMHAGAASPELQQVLQEILAKRDQVTAGLARGDAGMYGPVQELFRTTLERIG